MAFRRCRWALAVPTCCVVHHYGKELPAERQGCFWAPPIGPYFELNLDKSVNPKVLFFCFFQLRWKSCTCLLPFSWDSPVAHQVVYNLAPGQRGPSSPRLTDQAGAHCFHSSERSSSPHACLWIRGSVFQCGHWGSTEVPQLTVKWTVADSPCSCITQKHSLTHD